MLNPEFFSVGLLEKKVYLGGMSILSILLTLESGCHNIHVVVDILALVYVQEITTYCYKGSLHVVCLAMLKFLTHDPSCTMRFLGNHEVPFPAQLC
jgi:hypothetical protein